MKSRIANQSSHVYQKSQQNNKPSSKCLTCIFTPSFAEMSFQCLASWQSDTQGETYMSLLDTKLPQLGEEARPRYRCAVSESQTLKSSRFYEIESQTLKSRTLLAVV